MELDDLKNIWAAGSKETSDKHLTTKMIDEMTKRKYNSKMKRISYPEAIGILVCLFAVLFIGLNFYSFDTNFLKATAIVSILTLLLLSILSVLSIQPFTKLNDVNKTYAEMLKNFAIRKIRFYKLQKLNVMLSYLLLVTFIVLLSKLTGGVDLTENKYFWIFSFTLGYIFLMFYSRWVMKYYRKTLKQTEELLQDLSV